MKQAVVTLNVTQDKVSAHGEVHDAIKDKTLKFFHVFSSKEQALVELDEMRQDAYDFQIIVQDNTSKCFSSTNNFVFNLCV
jgi:hypothetical protein